MFNNIEVFNKYAKQNQSVVLAVSHYGTLRVIWFILRPKCEFKNKRKLYWSTVFNYFMNKTRGKFGAELIEMNQISIFLNKNKTRVSNYRTTC